jgi:hypothetical protein
MRRLRGLLTPAHLALAAILLAGLFVRVLHNTYGLPYVYNIDEGSHFTNRAVGMFGGSPDPGYFQNPSAFTYLEHLALRFQYGPAHLIPFANYHRVIGQFAHDPTAIYRTGRALAAVLCMLGVVAVYWVGRRLWGTFEGLAAAGVLSFAFLPVAYSRIAVTDVGTLLPVSFALYAAIRVYEGAGRRMWLLGGAMAGLAIGFKYTAGLVLLPLAIATIARMRREPRLMKEGLLALVAALGVFFVTNPYVFIDLSSAATSSTARRSWPASSRSSARSSTRGPATTSRASPGVSAGCRSSRCSAVWRWRRGAHGSGLCSWSSSRSRCSST